MVIQILLLKSSLPVLGKEMGGITITQSLMDLGQLRQNEGPVDLLPELQGLGRLGESQPDGPSQLHGDGQRSSEPTTTRASQGASSTSVGMIILPLFGVVLLFMERKKVVVMIIQSLLLKIYHPLLGKRRGGSHCHTQPSSQKLS